MQKIRIKNATVKEPGVDEDEISSHIYKLIAEQYQYKVWDLNDDQAMLTASKRNNDLLEELVVNGIDINYELNPQTGWTLLHEIFLRAIESIVYGGKHGTGQEKPDQVFLHLLKVLIINGADLKKRTTDGETPLDSLNYYAGSIKTFNYLKGIFREVVPDIDRRIQFIEREKRITRTKHWWEFWK